MQLLSQLFMALVLHQSGAASSRAMWTWHGGQLLAGSAARHDFFNFVRAPKGDASHPISVIFLGGVEVDKPDEKTALGNFIQECHQRGISVHFLCGDATWAEPAKESIGTGMVDEVLRFNASSPPAKRFDGFQFDVEPYSLPDWKTPAVRAGFLDLLKLSKAAIASAKSDMQFGAAIPRWYDAPDLGGLHKQVIDRVDYVAVMDYVSSSKQFVEDPANTVTYATLAGKKAWLGAEATELPTEPTATFYAKGNAAMEEAFASAGRAYRSQSGFAGVAVEYYETYAALRP
jgi:hypothetical protein